MESKSGHIINMMEAVLNTPDVESPQCAKGYCARGIEDYLEFDCENCAYVNYGRDCHNNPAWV